MTRTSLSRIHRCSLCGQWTIHRICTLHDIPSPMKSTFSPPPPAADTDNWVARAACRGLDDLAFSSKASDQERMLSICRACPVINECRAEVMARESGMARKQRYGITGGMTPRQRHEADPEAGIAPRTCAICGETFNGAANRSYCGDECRRASQRARHRRRGAVA